MVSEGDSLYWEKTLGSGTYGIVYSAKTDRGEDVAVKRNLVDKPTDFYHMVCEMEALNDLRGHPNIVQLCSVSIDEPFENTMEPLGRDRHDQKDGHVHFVFELGLGDAYHSSLYKYEIDRLRPMMADVLLGVEYIHAKGYIHRDIKPGNVLIFPGDVLKICDFGMVEQYVPGEQVLGVATSWYRAPELAMEKAFYTPKVDIWSVGCVFYEMVVGSPLIVPKLEANVSVLRKILQTVPMSEKMTKEIKKGRNLKNIELSDSYLEKLPTNLPEDFIKLLAGLLAVDHSERLTATIALNMPFFDPIRDKIDSVRTDFPIIPKQPISFTPGKDTEEIGKFTSEIYRKIYSPDVGYWLRLRPMLQAIDLYERTREISYTIEGCELSESYLSKLKFMNCLYICLKYFSVLRTVISFASMCRSVRFEVNLENPLIMDHLRDFEEEILFRRRIPVYNPTCFDYAPRSFQTSEISKLFEIYTSLPVDEQVYWGNIALTIFGSIRE